MHVRIMVDVVKMWCFLLLIVRTVAAICTPNPCQNNGICMVEQSGNSYICMCAAGFTGTTCQSTIAAICTCNPCQNNGTCMLQQSGASYDCMCAAGFTGTTCQNDECVPNPCQNGGMCIRQTTGNTYDCDCAMTGFVGTVCENRDACNPNPCQNGGMCLLRSQGTFQCTCPAGVTGNTCENNPCNPSPCQNGGMCSPQPSGNMYNCMCPNGVTGTNCENNRCVPSPCQNGGTCSPQSSGNMYDCMCPNGVTGTNCETNRCDSSPCQNGGTCSPQSSGNMYDCMCPNGVTGTNCENPAANANTTTIIIVVVVVVLVVLIVALGIVVVCFMKRSRRKRSRSKSSTAESGPGQELAQKRRSNEYQSKTAAKAKGKSREFPRDKLHLFGQVGSGSFAVVYKADAEGIVREGTFTTVAVKMLKESASPNDQSDFKKELHLYTMLDRHPNVLSMLGCCTDKDPMYIILEYVPHGNLQSYLRHIRTGTEPAYQNKAEFKKDNLTPTEILTFASQVVRGMEYLASKQCIHRDLATRNILLGEGLVCKVADFGLARDVAEQNQYEMRSQGRVPVRWMASESLISNMYTSKSDVWSFGVLLWELVTLGSHPYPGMSSQKVISELKKGYRLPKPDHCSDDVYKVMTDCWQERPTDRPDFAKLHFRIDDLLADATGYLEMGNLNRDDYTYLEPGQPSSTESN